MRAVVLEQFGTLLVLRDVAKPTPGPGEVLVRIIASGVNPLDTKIRAGKAAHAQTRLQPFSASTQPESSKPSARDV